MTNYIAAAILGIFVIGGYFLLPDQKQFAAVKMTNPDIEGAESVGIVFKDAKSVSAILSQFTVAELPCDPTATSSDCTYKQASYKGVPVHVYAVLPLGITTDFATAVADFPFAGQLHHKDLQDADVDIRVVKMMQEGGNKTFDVIYEK